MLFKQISAFIVLDFNLKFSNEVDPRVSGRSGRLPVGLNFGEVEGRVVSDLNEKEDEEEEEEEEGEVESGNNEDDEEEEDDDEGGAEEEEEEEEGADKEEEEERRKNSDALIL